MAQDPTPEDLYTHDFAPTPITEEKGERAPKGKEKTVMVDSALFAVQEIMAKHPEALLYGQDVGHRLGGVFRKPLHWLKSLVTIAFTTHLFKKLLLLAQQ